MKTAREPHRRWSGIEAGTIWKLLLAGAAFAPPVWAEPGMQVSAGTDRWVEAGLLLDLATPQPGDERRPLAQMRLGGAYSYSGHGLAGLWIGYSLARRGHRVAAGVALDGFLLAPLRVDRRHGNAGTVAELRGGVFVQTRPSAWLRPFASVDYRIRVREIHGRAGIILSPPRPLPG